MSMVRDIAEMIGRTFHSSMVLQGPDGHFYMVPEDEGDGGQGWATAPEHIGNLHAPSVSTTLVVVDDVEYRITIERADSR